MRLRRTADGAALCKSPPSHYFGEDLGPFALARTSEHSVEVDVAESDYDHQTFEHHLREHETVSAEVLFVSDGCMAGWVVKVMAGGRGRRSHHLQRVGFFFSRGEKKAPYSSLREE
uniref:Uncharacterized protein n=1 Tax=Marseillevirus LCMAC103 TaxID=2506604 RepID=A0A481YW05_9VIRU|nr:MAG: hypothetical protein LCMAC103_00150 [Marseillevirus LCMAC103]